MTFLVQQAPLEVILNQHPENPDLCVAWRALLALGGAKHDRGPVGRCDADEITTSELAKLFQAGDEAVRRLIDLYLPHCRHRPGRFVVAHLGQSLDGRIAAANGSSRWVTGPADVVHNHRMRALFDAVVVGAGTVCYDDPRLTVRAVEGRSPVRVVIDPGRRLGVDFKVFNDGAAETLLLCRAACATAAERHGQAEVIGVEDGIGGLAPQALLDLLERRRLGRVFVEGGGVTVSRFLDAGCLHRLQLTIAPVIIGSGVSSISLPEIDDVSAGLRPPTRRFPLGDDMLIECCFDDGD